MEVADVFSQVGFSLCQNLRVRARTDHYHPKVIEVVESIVHGSFFSQPLRLESLIS